MGLLIAGASLVHIVIMIPARPTQRVQPRINKYINKQVKSMVKDEITVDPCYKNLLWN